VPTAQKAAVIEQTKQWCDESTGLIFTDYRGLSVPELQTLRQSLRETGGEFHVVKNTLFRVAIGDKVGDLPYELHNGPTATAFLFREEPACAKLLVKFAKDHKAFEIKGGWLDGKALSASEVEAFSKLPTRHELLSMIVGLVAAPMSNLVGVMNEMLAQPVRVIDAIIEKQGGAPAEAAPAPAPEEPAVVESTPAEEPAAEASPIEETTAEAPSEEPPAEEPSTEQAEPAPDTEEQKEGQD
jgi:large subunit ribosomal protein L10